MQQELCCSAKSCFLPMKAQARFPAEFHYRERGAIPLESINGSQAVVWCSRNESLILAHLWCRRLGDLSGEVLTLLKLVPKFPLTSSRSGISPIKFLDVREAAEYWILFNHPGLWPLQSLHSLAEICWEPTQGDHKRVAQNGAERDTR